ncbi:CRISPR-associated helicase Cas3' [Bacillus sp. FJAT-47783]|uniref:CRISPR-associated helicase Cas3' n=1 Tax=Bacillus sp. FJAT-47783 TaxID=2922712 RepID=UPI001FAE204B
METLLSHPDYSLQLHVQGVLKQIEHFIDEKNLSFHDNEEIKEIAELLGLFHDIGKATSYFQKYIRHVGDIKISNQLKSHSLLSAFLLYQFMNKELDTHFSDDRLILISFLIVKRHHGQLTNWLDEFKQFNHEMKEQLIMQIDSIDFRLLNETFKTMPYYSPLTKDVCESWVEDLFKEARKIRRKVMQYNRDGNSLSLYIQYLFLFSILIDADKSEAGILQRHHFPKRKDLANNLIKTYKSAQQWKKTELNQLREKAFQEVDQHNIDLSNHFYSLQLPTGLGKTLTSIQFALNLRRVVEETEGIKPRIIYSLPFLSVIDQTEQIIQTIFKENQIKVDQSLVLAHHHLADFHYSIYDQESYQTYDYNAAKLLIEGWNAEIILTTFIQLFQTIFSNKNKSLRKFHRLANAIIIIDEVQAIPHKYWLVIRETMKALSENLGCYFVFSSATTPAILPKEEITQLVVPENYYHVLSRVELFAHMAPVTITDLIDSLQLDDHKSYLFIFNTIGSAKEFYEEMTELIDGDEVTFLSTHITPYERLKRIKDMKSGKYRVVVSTQLVEAGVDIDFDVVYRDIAPLDSIHQAAGRCNRNGLNKGEVHVIHLKDGHRSYASYIYDAIRLNVTKELLRTKPKLSEKEFLQYIEIYFQKLLERVANKESTSLLNGMKTLYFDGEVESDRIPISHFKLIEENHDRIEVFIELNDEARDIFNRFEKILDIQNRWEQQEKFSKINSKFHQYVVSIPLKVDHKPPLRNGIGYVGQDQLSDFYDLVLGYKTSSTGLIW